MKLCVIGTGYVGLVTGTCFAATGQRVVCVDTDAGKIERLKRYEIPIYEPGLEEMVRENASAGRLTFTTDLASAVRDVDLAFIAVGTPPTHDGEADLSAVFTVAQELAKHATHDLVIVNKSTVPVGTNAQVQKLVADAKHDIQVASNPEFLKEGGAINDFMYPDRIVVGVRPGHERARRLMDRVYHPLNLSSTKIVWMNPESAEVTKYAANTMLAMRISFMNELAVLCEEVGADVQSVRKGVGSDPRIGSQFLHAGPGYGGSCASVVVPVARVVRARAKLVTVLLFGPVRTVITMGRTEADGSGQLRVGHGRNLAVRQDLRTAFVGHARS